MVSQQSKIHGLRDQLAGILIINQVDVKTEGKLKIQAKDVPVELLFMMLIGIYQVGFPKFIYCSRLSHTGRLNDGRIIGIRL